MRCHELMNELKLDPGYYKSEVREGFRIAEMTKRYWAVQMKVLSEIDRVCRNHGLKWFADFGTLLGTVRHGGFIPWDDDIDIVMLRSDYEVFLDYAVKELPESYVVLDVRLNSDYDDQNGRVVNSHQIGFSPEYLEHFCGCPYTAGIDIYLLDSVYEDPDMERSRCERAVKVRTLRGLVAENLPEKDEERLRLISEVESENNVKLPQVNGLLHFLDVLIRNIYAECDDDNSKKIAYMPGWIWSCASYGYSREWYGNQTYLPFEKMEMPVPSNYKEVLKVEYGNYMEIKRGAGATHPYPVYVVQQKILLDYLADRHEDRLIGYINAISDKRMEHGSQCKEILGACGQAINLIGKLSPNDTASMKALLQSIGNLMDNLTAMLTADYDESTKANKLTLWFKGELIDLDHGLGSIDSTLLSSRLGRIGEKMDDLSNSVNELYYGVDPIDLGDI